MGTAERDPDMEEALATLKMLLKNDDARNLN
jgi:hypothetical protein